MLVGIQEVIIICVPEEGTGTIKCEIQGRRKKKLDREREKRKWHLQINKAIAPDQKSSFMPASSTRSTRDQLRHGPLSTNLNK